MGIKDTDKNKPILGEVALGAVRQRYSGYPSNGLTPERLSAIFMEADQGNVLRQMELFEEMEEKDAHLGSVLASRKLAVAGLEWELTAPSESTQGSEITAFTREALKGMDNWDESVMDLLDALGKGFSVLEIIWALKSGKVIPERLAWITQKHFSFTTASGPVRTPQLLTEASPAYGEVLLGDKFLVHTYQGRSGFPFRGGLLRPSAWMYLFKNYTLKDWIIFSERFAQPMRVGKFGSGASEDDRKVLRDAVFNLGTDAAAVISDSTVIELLESSGKGASADIYKELADFCDRAISKSVLGQTLTTEQSGGTYATAKVHQTVRQDILEADSKALARTINTQLIRPLVRFNFGPQAPLPQLRFNHEAPEDLAALAQTYKTLTEMGISIPADFVQERFGIPVK
jgi:phage gp29-like protein